MPLDNADRKCILLSMLQSVLKRSHRAAGHDLLEDSILDHMKPATAGAPAPGQILVTQWMVIDQDLIDRFADVIDDRQFIHVDPVRAASESQFGGTIAHGFLLLSLLTKLSRQVFSPVPAGVAEVNYGFDKVRFLAPVRAGANIRGRFEPTSQQQKGSGILDTYRVTLEIEGSEKPAVAADWLVLATK